jgi:cell division protein FtsL
MSAVAPLPYDEPTPRTRSRQHGEVATRQPVARRELVKITADVRIEPSHAPQLHIVPRRRKAVGVVVVGFVFLFALLLGATAFQTQIARNQLEIDRTETAVKNARERYDNLRRERAELRSPNRLAIKAAELGMVPAESGEFMEIDGSISARIAVTSGDLSISVSQQQPEPFDQFSEIKAVEGDTP